MGMNFKSRREMKSRALLIPLGFYRRIYSFKLKLLSYGLMNILIGLLAYEFQSLTSMQYSIIGHAIC